MSVHVSSVLFFTASVQLVISVTQITGVDKFPPICFYLGNRIYFVNFLYLLEYKKDRSKRNGLCIAELLLMESEEEAYASKQSLGIAIRCEVLAIEVLNSLSHIHI